MAPTTRRRALIEKLQSGSGRKLSFEVLIQIFLLLDRPSRIQCQFTCKTWRYPAVYATYQEFSLDSLFQRCRGFPENNVLSLLDMLSKPPYNPGHYIKKLDINCLETYYSHWESLREHQSFLTTLAQSCPNVEELDGYVVNSKLWNALLKLFKNGHWSHVKRLPLPLDNQSFSGYMEAAEAVSETLESLYIHVYTDSRYGSRLYAESAQELAQKLEKLKSVKTLECLLDIGKGNLAEHDTLVDSCSLPLLENLTLYSLPRHCIRNGPLSTHTTKPCSSKIKNVNLYFSAGDDAIIKFVMKRYPFVESFNLNGDSLTGKISELDLTQYPLIEHLSIDTMNEFMDYLWKRKAFKIDLLLADEERLESIISRIIITKIVQLKKKISLQILSERDIYTGRRNNPEYRGSVVSLSSQCNRKNVIEISMGIEPFYQNYLQQCFGDVEYLNLDLSYNEPMTARNPDEPEFDNLDQTFDYIFQHYTSLKTLRVARTLVTDSATNGETINSSIYELVLDRCAISSSTLTALSNQLPNLKKLEILNSPFDVTAGTVLFGGLNIVPGFALYMPYNSLDSIRWSNSYDFLPKECTQLFLKISSGKEHFYFIIDNLDKQAHKSSLEEFKRQLCKKRKKTAYSLLYIKCKKLKKLTLSNPFKREQDENMGTITITLDSERQPSPKALYINKP